MKLISKKDFDRFQEMQKAIPALEQELAMMAKPPKEKTVYLQHETFDIQDQRYIDEMNMIGKSPYLRFLVEKMKSEWVADMQNTKDPNDLVQLAAQIKAMDLLTDYLTEFVDISTTRRRGKEFNLEKV